jgi:hypothetical protein
VDRNGANGWEGNKVDEAKSGSVTVSIYRSRNSRKVRKKPVEGAPPDSIPEFEIRYYDSFVIPYYEGSIRKTPRRNTLEKAKELADEVAKRLNRDGAKADFLSEQDRRIYILARTSARTLHMDVDSACRKLLELQQRLKTGTLEQAVDFHNDHGQKVRHGVENKEIYTEYLDHLEKRGAGDYYLRDVRRYLDPFIAEFPATISPIQTEQIDNYLGSLDAKQQEKRKDKAHKTRARSKNNVRDAIIGFFNFAKEKGFLPQGIPHAASQTTEFRDARQKITSEEQALELMKPNDIYLPEEMSKILVAAKEHEPLVLPSLEIKGFSGVRTEEIMRIWWVMAALRNSGARRVLDLGCGEGKLLQVLLKDRQFEEIVGMDVAYRGLEIAKDRLHLDRLPDNQKKRIQLLHGSLMYRDNRLAGFEAGHLSSAISIGGENVIRVRGWSERPNLCLRSRWSSGRKLSVLLPSFGHRRPLSHQRDQFNQATSRMLVSVDSRRKVRLHGQCCQRDAVRIQCIAEWGIEFAGFQRHHGKHW